MLKKPQDKAPNKIDKKRKKKAGQTWGTENDCIEQLKDLTAIKDLAQKIVSTLSLNQVIASAYENILSTVGPDLAVIYLLDGDKLITQGEKPENPIFKQESPDIKSVGQCLCGLVAKDGEPIYSIDIHTDHRCTLYECKKAGLSSFAALPLIVDRDIQGVLGIGSFTKRDFSQQASFLEMLSIHIAIAIKNAKLHEKLEDYSKKLNQTLLDLVKSDEEKKLAQKNWGDIFQAIRNPIFILDINHNILMANPAAENLTGMLKEDLLGKKCHEIIHGIDMPAECCPVEEMLKTGQLETFEMQMETIGGIFLVSCTPVLDEKGQIEKIIHISTDITERKHVEKALYESERKYRELVEKANSIILRWNRLGEITYLNEFGLKFFGYTEAEIVGQHVVGTIVPETESSGRDLRLLMEEICLHPLDFERNINENILRNGDRVWIDWTNKIVLNEQGKLIEILSIGSDITERKELEKSLQESESRYRRLLGSIMDAFVVVDMDGSIKEFNHVYRDMLGYEQDELRNLTYQDITPEKWHEFEKEIIEKQVLLRGYSEIYQKEYRKKDGTIFPVELRAYLLKDETGKPIGMWGIIHDITKRKQAEEALKESEVRFKAQYHGSPTPTFTWQKKGDDFVLVDYNNAAAVITNSGVAQYIGKTAHEMYELQQDVLEDLGRCFEEKTIIRKELQSKHFLPGRLIITTYVFVPNDLVMVHIEDITDRKLGEEALRKSEERYRTIFENTGSASILMGEDTTILLANSKFQELSGYSRQEIEGKMSWTSFVDEEDLERMKQYHELRRKESESVPGSYEFRSINRKGEKRNIILNVALIPGTNESVASLMDITERKWAEEACLESEERFRLAFNTSPDAININRLEDGLYVDINEGFTALTGFTREDAIGKTSVEINIWHNADDRRKLVQSLRAKGYYENLEAQFTRKDGSITTALMSARVIMLKGVPHIISITRDIAERKHAEEVLRESERRYRLLIEQAADGVFLTEADGKFILVNSKICEMLGYAEEELYQLNILDTYPEEIRGNGYERLAHLKSGENIRFERPMKRKDGSVFLIEASGTKLDDGRTQGIIHDITALKRAEEEKMKLEYELIQAQKMESIGTLAGGIAHDFNNILSAIIGYTQLAMDDVSEPEKARKELKEVLKASDRAKDLVSQILTFSRKADVRYSPISLHKTVMDSIKMMRSVIPTTIDIRQDLIDHGMIMADPTQIHQVMLNLCTNAAHAMDKTGGTMEVRLRRVDIGGGTRSIEPDLPPGSYLWLSVSDTGHGMTPEIMARIFDPYFTTKEIGKGTGLGLAVVHGIVQSHGGTITCTSSPGKGTTFDIYLPEILSEEVVIRQHEGKPLPIGTERILFVDDEPILVELAKKMLSKLGYTVVTKSSSSEALELFQKDPDKYDLVITDMTMPGITGDKLAQKFIEIRHDIPIILCSGYSEHISEDKAKKIGIREFVMKPLEMKALAKTIRKVLDGV